MVVKVNLDVFQSQHMDMLHVVLVVNAFCQNEGSGL